MKSKKELVLASNKSILSDFLGESDLKVNLEKSAFVPIQQGDNPCFLRIITEDGFSIEHVFKNKHFTTKSLRTGVS